MAIVKITPMGESINCQAGGYAKFQFNISNATDKEIRYGIQLRADDGIASWLTIDGEIERSLQASSGSTIEVNAEPPSDLLREEDGKKSFNFKIRVYDVKNPESIVDSDTVSVVVKPAAAEPKPLPWKWILIAVVGLIVVSSVIWLLTKSDTEDYRYYRLTVTKVRNITAPGSSMVQLAELNFFNGGTRLTSATITNPAGSNPLNEEPDKANDGNSRTKWLDFNITPLIYDFGSSVSVDSYQITTANDFNGRDPVRWVLEGSNDAASWVILDNQANSDFPTPTARFTPTSIIELNSN